MKFWKRIFNKNKKEIEHEPIVQMEQQVEHYALDSLEQIIEFVGELDEVRLEYENVTSYLNDMQIIDQIPDEMRVEINGVAEEIIKIKDKRKEFQNSTNKLTQMQYVEMQKYEDEIPASIKKLRDNESYLSAVKRDMNHVEGEKGAWDYERKSLLDEQKLLQKLLFFISSLFIVVCAVAFLLQTFYYMDMNLVYLSTCFVAAISGFYIFLRIQKNSMRIQQVQVNLNHAIVVLNRIKAKYVNFTNVVEYTCEKYSVHNAHELQYLWDQYMLMKEQRKAYCRTSGDLENLNQKLIRLLRQYNIKDTGVWLYQVEALVDNKEMVEIRHNLILRRQKLRTRIESINKQLTELKEEIIRFVKENPSYRKEVEEILSSIDSFEGI